MLSRALLLWATVVGGTSLEVFGQYGADTFRDPSQAYDQQVRMALAVLRGGLDPPDSPSEHLTAPTACSESARGQRPAATRASGRAPRRRRESVGNSSR